MTNDNKMLNEIASKKIKEFRILKNFTQEDLSTLLNLDRTTYSKIETGKTEISLNILQRISHALDVEVEHILEVSPLRIVNINADKIILSANGSNSILNLTLSTNEVKDITSL